MTTNDEAWNSAMDLANRFGKMAEGRDSNEVLMSLAFLLAQVLKQTTANEEQVRAEMEKFVTAAVNSLKIMREAQKDLN